MTNPAPQDVDLRAPPLPCLRCAYDLRGLPAEGNCPECGLPVERSAVTSDELRHAPPRWLASLSWGARVVLAVSVLAFGYGQFVADRVPPVSTAILFIAPALFGLAFAAGVWLLTRGQRRFASSHPVVRGALRIVSLVPLFQTAVSYGFASGLIRGPVEFRDVVILGLIPLPALLFFHLRGLALRVLDPSLAEHCAIVGVGGSFSFATASLGMFSPLPTVLQMSSVVGVMLFFLWSLYLMLLFTIAFERARRASVAMWGRDG